MCILHDFIVIEYSLYCSIFVFFLMSRRPPRSTRTDTLFPYTTLFRSHESAMSLYFKPGNTSENINNILAYFYQAAKGPARLAGQMLLVHDTLNQATASRQAWVYNPGQRRVRRAPNVVFANPGPASAGPRTNDMTDTFNGPMQRHECTTAGQ